MTSTLEAKAQGENMMTRRWLYSLANRLIDEDDKPRVDQLAKRHRKGILIWFTENCPELDPSSLLEAPNAVVQLKPLHGAAARDGTMTG
jgi:hypothetical protein